MDEMLLNELMSEEIANKLKEILKDVPEPKEVKPEPIEEKKVKPKKVKVKETKEATPGKETTTNNTVKGKKEEEVKEEIRVNSLNLAMAVKFLTLSKYTTVSNKDEKTKHKYKNYFMFENTESVRKALAILNILKAELRKEQLEKMEDKVK